MQRFFSGLLCFSALLMLCGCATSKGDYSSAGREPIPQTETKAVAPASGATENKVAMVPGTPPAGTTTGEVSQRTGPIAEVPEKFFDFGTMSEDMDYSHAFIVKNVGTSELTIKKVLPG